MSSNIASLIFCLFVCVFICLFLLARGLCGRYSSPLAAQSL